MLQNQHLQLAEAGLEKKGYLGTAPQIIPSKLVGVVFSLGICFCQSAICNLLHRLRSVSYFDFPAVAVSKSIVEKQKKQSIWFICKQPNVLFFFLLSVGWCGLGRKPGVSVYHPILLLSTSLLSMWCPREANWDNKTLHSPEPRKCFWKLLMR